jgi:hypothetical protein
MIGKARAIIVEAEIMRGTGSNVGGSEQVEDGGADQQAQRRRTAGLSCRRRLSAPLTSKSDDSSAALTE